MIYIYNFFSLTVEKRIVKGPLDPVDGEVDDSQDGK